MSEQTALWYAVGADTQTPLTLANSPHNLPSYIASRRHANKQEDDIMEKLDGFLLSAGIDRRELVRHTRTSSLEIGTVRKNGKIVGIDLMIWWEGTYIKRRRVIVKDGVLDTRALRLKALELAALQNRLY